MKPVFGSAADIDAGLEGVAPQKARQRLAENGLQEYRFSRESIQPTYVNGNKALRVPPFPNP
jgi:hypothetical protein